jgi:excisionase family DNA binding protein
VDEQLMTEDEVAEYLRVTKRTVRAWRLESTGPPWLRVGRFIRYRRGDVDGWLERQRDRDR